MSFRDLKDEVYLVLQVNGGHGFGFATSPLVVTANLGGNIHESFVTEASPQPKFENEFVWVMDKNKLKSIWTDKVPVRVECLSVNQSRRSRIGYIILNVKDAQIIQDENKVVEKQLRLLGLSKEASQLKPELFLSFYITDIPIHSSQLTPQFSPPLENKRIQLTGSPLKVVLGSGRDHFNLVVKVVNVANFKHLLPSQSETEPALMTYCYSLLGAELLSDESTDHGVQLAITSSLASLKTYFIHKPSVPVTLLVGSLPVGNTIINLEKLMCLEDLSRRRVKNKLRSATCHCEIIPAHSMSVTNPETIASVDFTVTLTSEPHVSRKQLEVLNTIGAGGDAGSIPPLLAPATPLVTQSLTALQTQTAESGRETYRTQSQIIYRAPESGGETYRTQQPTSTHTVTITISSLHLDNPLPPNSWLRLSHPSGEVSPRDQVILPTEDNHTPPQYQLTLRMPRRLLQTTLSSQPVLLQLGCGDQVIAVSNIFLPHNLSSLPKGSEMRVTLESEGVTVGETCIGMTSGDIQSHITAPTSTISDLSLGPPTSVHFQPRYVGAEVLSPRSRELKILSFVEELEDWAEKQRMIVMEGLKKEEEARLSLLQAQWQEKVGGQLAEGKMLVEALHDMREQLRQQEAEIKENQHKLKIYREDLDFVHRSKLQQFKDLSRKMQDEFNHKLSMIAADKKLLEKEVEALRKENQEIKQALEDAEAKAIEDKKAVDSLTHELNMLKEKFNLEQESKKFFKDHCRKAEQEIHRLNQLRQQELEARLYNEKKSLEQLALQQIIVERNDLRQDQRLLDEIRHQLVPQPSQTDLHSDSTNTDGNILTDIRHIRRAT